jgi:hypothetical protein
LTHDGRAAEHGEKWALEIAVDMFILFKHDQDDAVAVGLAHKLIDNLHMG